MKKLDKKNIKYNNKFVDDLRSESYADDLYDQENSHKQQKFIEQLEGLENNQQLEPIDELREQYPDFSLDPLVALIIDKKIIKKNSLEYIQIRLLERNGACITMAVYQKNYRKFENILIGRVYQFSYDLKITKFHSSFILEYSSWTHIIQTDIEIIDKKLEFTIAEQKKAEKNKDQLFSLICFISQIEINDKYCNLTLVDQSDKLEMKMNIEDFNLEQFPLFELYLIQNFKISKSGQFKLLKKTTIYNLDRMSIFNHQPKFKILQNFKLFQKIYLEHIFNHQRAYFSKDILQSTLQLRHNFISISKAQFEFNIIDMKKIYQYCLTCNNKDLSQCQHQNDFTIEYVLAVQAEKLTIIASIFSNIIICDFDLNEQKHAQGQYISK
ncbi:hypothetical protein pb186bvf_004168 [Paramecium bursaria]